VDVTPEGHGGVLLDHGDIVEAPTWFGPDDRPLFGWFTYPKGLAVRGAVVLCQPVAEESNMAYRTFRRLAQQLAREGFLALRFDYDGTGDSAGSFEEPQRMTAWTESVAHAVAEARRWGAPGVSVVGMRLGATLAYLAAASSPLDLSDLILWDPCLTAKTFLRELQLLQNSWIGDVVTARDGTVETPCYRFSSEFAVEGKLAAIDGRVPVARLARRTTVLARDDRSPLPRLLAALPVDETEWVEVAGQAALLNVPTLEASVPESAVDAVVARLGKQTGSETSKITARLRPVAEWAEGGRRIQEEAAFFGSTPSLFGIATTSSAVDGSQPRLMFLNVASKRHIGEGRIWVELARESTAKGFASVRIDHSGVGDSPTGPGHADDKIYDEAWIDDVPRIARSLSDENVPNIIGVGLCSSGTSVLQAAMLGSFREVIAINVPFDADLNAGLPRRWTLFPRKPEWLRRYAIGHRRIAGLLWSASSVVDPRRDIMWMLRSIVSGGTKVTLLTGPEDLARIRHNPLWQATWGRRLTTSPRFRLQALPTADHSLGAGPGRDEAAEAVLDRLRAYEAAPLPVSVGVGQRSTTLPR
jgi:alpha-beta hydrolase superfamily lysophospholipase